MPFFEDSRPTWVSSNHWGLWSSIEGRDLQENTWSDVRIQGDRQHCFSSHNLSALKTPFWLKGVEGYGLGQLYWFARLYNVVDCLIDGCDFHDIGAFAQYSHEGVSLTPHGKREGHALYFNLHGDLSILQTHFQNCLGQGVQVVNRPHETLIQDPPSGTIQIKDSTFQDCSRDPGDRAAYPLSIFNTRGHDCFIRRVSIWSTDETPVWYNSRTSENCRSRGGALFEGASDKKLSIKHLNVLLLDPDRPAVKIRGWESIDWEGGVLEPGGLRDRPLQIDIETPNPQNVNIRGLEGNYTISVNGETASLAA